MTSPPQQALTSNDRYLTVPEAAQLLGVGTSLIKRLIREDPTFKSLKIGARRKIRASSLERWVRQQESK